MIGYTAVNPEPVATEPRHEPECTFCDGQGEVSVVEVEDVGGRRYTYRFPGEHSHPCPCCVEGLTLNGEVLE